MDELKKAIETLDDPNAGWATRKETALALGAAAGDALRALRDHVNDADQDVRAAVRDAMQHVPIVRATVPPEARKQFSFDELAQACAKPGKRSVTREDDGYKVEVRIDDKRMQDVFIRVEKKDDGTEIVRVYTVCGKPDSSNAAWALRKNAELIGCSFAVENHRRFEHLILVQNFLVARVTPEEVAAAVKQLGYYGDWLEKRLTGQDDY